MTAASLLLFLVMPVFPREVMVFVAIGLGVLAFKVATLSLVLMVLLALPGYMYQLSAAAPAGVGIPVAVIGAMSAVVLLIAAVAGEMGGALGIAAGATAAALMLTPLGFLALPLIIGTVFVRTEHTRVRIGGAILTFIVLYYPFLAATTAAAHGPVALLQPVSFTAAPPVSVLSFEEISAKLGQIVSTAGSRETPAYLRSIAEYWPLSPEQRLLPAGVLFGLLSGAAAAVVAGVLAFFRWLSRREVGGTRLVSVAPVPAALVGVVAFTFLAHILAQPLGIVGPGTPLLMVIGAMGAGASGSLAEVWLKRRDVTVDLREQLADKAAVVRSGTDLLVSRTEETKAQCRRMDTSGEDALRQMCEQELAFTEQAVAEMSSTDLKTKVATFDKLKDKLHVAVTDSSARLYQYYDEDRQRYNDALMLAKAFGFSLGEAVGGPDFAALSSMEYGEVLELQNALNERYETSVRSLAEGVVELEGRLTHVDPDLKRTGIDIARDYLARGQYPEALEEFLRELGDIEHALDKTVAGLGREIRFVLGSLRTIVAEILMQTAARLGDVASVRYYREDVLSRIDSLTNLPGDKSRLPDLVRIVSAVVELGDLIAEICSRTGDKVTSLETSIQSKAPRGYEWAVDPELPRRLTELSRALSEPKRPIGIHERMSLIKSGPSVVDSGAYVVNTYSIALELLINFANIETVIEQRLREEGVVKAADLPVARKYALKYLQIYGLKHPGGVSVERDMGTLSRLTQASLP